MEKLAIGMTLLLIIYAAFAMLINWLFLSERNFKFWNSTYYIQKLQDFLQSFSYLRKLNKQ